ncbi:MAG: BrnT family toxin [Anaerolineales bacterium]|nr:BrnT family toxin [Anaerolineales bacterium]
MDFARSGVHFRYWYNPFMPFEYDPRKSDSNRAKHGIDFDEAQAL